MSVNYYEPQFTLNKVLVMTHTRCQQRLTGTFKISKFLQKQWGTIKDQTKIC